MFNSGFLLFILLCFALFYGNMGQTSYGFMSDPAARGAMWRFGFQTPVNYNDNALNCGGIEILQRNSRDCGVCGDSVEGSRDHEAGGQYASGIIVHNYPVGTTLLPITIETLEYKSGYFEFRICPHNDPTRVVSQECLNRNLLRLSEGTIESDRTVFRVPYHPSHTYTLHAQLPSGLTCSQCVLQWRYYSGNDSTSYEEYRNCADISIENSTMENFSQNIGDVESMSNNDLLASLLILADVNPSGDTNTSTTELSSNTSTDSSGMLLDNLLSMGLLVPDTAAKTVTPAQVIAGSLSFDVQQNHVETNQGNYTADTNGVSLNEDKNVMDMNSWHAKDSRAANENNMLWWSHENFPYDRQLQGEKQGVSTHWESVSPTVVPQEVVHTVNQSPGHNSFQTNSNEHKIGNNFQNAFRTQQHTNNEIHFNKVPSNDNTFHNVFATNEQDINNQFYPEVSTTFAFTRRSGPQPTPTASTIDNIPLSGATENVESHDATPYDINRPSLVLESEDLQPTETRSALDNIEGNVKTQTTNFTFSVLGINNPLIVSPPESNITSEQLNVQPYDSGLSKFQINFLNRISEEHEQTSYMPIVSTTQGPAFTNQKPLTEQTRAWIDPHTSQERNTVTRSSPIGQAFVNEKSTKETTSVDYTTTTVNPIDPKNLRDNLRSYNPLFVWSYPSDNGVTRKWVDQPKQDIIERSSLDKNISPLENSYFQNHEQQFYQEQYAHNLKVLSSSSSKSKHVLPDSENHQIIPVHQGHRGHIDHSHHQGNHHRMSSRDDTYVWVAPSSEGSIEWKHPGMENEVFQASPREHAISKSLSIEAVGWQAPNIESSGWQAPPAETPRRQIASTEIARLRDSTNEPSEWQGLLNENSAWQTPSIETSGWQSPPMETSSGQAPSIKNSGLQVPPIEISGWQEPSTDTTSWESSPIETSGWEAPLSFTPDSQNNFKDDMKENVETQNYLPSVNGEKQHTLLQDNSSELLISSKSDIKTTNSESNLELYSLISDNVERNQTFHEKPQTAQDTSTFDGDPSQLGQSVKETFEQMRMDQTIEKTTSVKKSNPSSMLSKHYLDTLPMETTQSKKDLTPSQDDTSQSRDDMPHSSKKILHSQFDSMHPQIDQSHLQVNISKPNFGMLNSQYDIPQFSQNMKTSKIDMADVLDDISHPEVVIRNAQVDAANYRKEIQSLPMELEILRSNMQSTQLALSQSQSSIQISDAEFETTTPNPKFDRSPSMYRMSQTPINVSPSSTITPYVQNSYLPVDDSLTSVKKAKLDLSSLASDITKALENIKITQNIFNNSIENRKVSINKSNSDNDSFGTHSSFEKSENDMMHSRNAMTNLQTNITHMKTEITNPPKAMTFKQDNILPTQNHIYAQEGISPENTLGNDILNVENDILDLENVLNSYNILEHSQNDLKLNQNSTMFTKSGMGNTQHFTKSDGDLTDLQKEKDNYIVKRLNSQQTTTNSQSETLNKINNLMYNTSTIGENSQSTNSYLQNSDPSPNPGTDISSHNNLSNSNIPDKILLPIISEPGPPHSISANHMFSEVLPTNNTSQQHMYPELPQDVNIEMGFNRTKDDRDDRMLYNKSDKGLNSILFNTTDGETTVADINFQDTRNHISLNAELENTLYKSIYPESHTIHQNHKAEILTPFKKLELPSAYEKGITDKLNTNENNTESQTAYKNNFPETQSAYENNNSEIYLTNHSIILDIIQDYKDAYNRNQTSNPENYENDIIHQDINPDTHIPYESSISNNYLENQNLIHIPPKPTGVRTNYDWQQNESTDSLNKQFDVLGDTDGYDLNTEEVLNREDSKDIKKENIVTVTAISVSKNANNLSMSTELSPVTRKRLSDYNVENRATDWKQGLNIDGNNLLTHDYPIISDMSSVTQGPNMWIDPNSFTAKHLDTATEMYQIDNDKEAINKSMATSLHVPQQSMIDTVLSANKQTPNRLPLQSQSSTNGQQAQILVKNANREPTLLESVLREDPSYSTIFDSNSSLLDAIAMFEETLNEHVIPENSSSKLKQSKHTDSTLTENPNDTNVTADITVYQTNTANRTLPTKMQNNVKQDSNWNIYPEDNVVHNSNTLVGLSESPNSSTELSSKPTFYEKDIRPIVNSSNDENNVSFQSEDIKRPRSSASSDFEIITRKPIQNDINKNNTRVNNYQTEGMMPSFEYTTQNNPKERNILLDLPLTVTDKANKQTNSDRGHSGMLANILKQNHAEIETITGARRDIKNETLQWNENLIRDKGNIKTISNLSTSSSDDSDSKKRYEVRLPTNKNRTSSSFRNVIQPHETDDVANNRENKTPILFRLQDSEKGFGPLLIFKSKEDLVKFFNALKQMTVIERVQVLQKLRRNRINRIGFKRKSSEKPKQNNHFRTIMWDTRPRVMHMLQQLSKTAKGRQILRDFSQRIKEFEKKAAASVTSEVTSPNTKVVSTRSLFDKISVGKKKKDLNVDDNHPLQASQNSLTTNSLKSDLHYNLSLLNKIKLVEKALTKSLRKHMLKPTTNRKGVQKVFVALRLLEKRRLNLQSQIEFMKRQQTIMNLAPVLNEPVVVSNGDKRTVLLPSGFLDKMKGHNSS